jgi:hypothetical protein
MRKKNWSTSWIMSGAVEDRNTGQHKRMWAHVGHRSADINATRSSTGNEDQHQSAMLLITTTRTSLSTLKH